jgi:hypothetical protein
MELRMPWDLALFLGAVLPRNIEEHRAMLRGGRHFQIRINGATGAGLPMFWEIAPGIVVRSS